MTQKEDKFECEVDFSESHNFGHLSWMVRPCEWYLQEYTDCKSIRGRIHQYFVGSDGSYDNCDGWRDDHYNCSMFRKNQSPDLLNRLIESELARKEKRFAQSRANDVWEYRAEPPSDWNRPVKKMSSTSAN